MTSVYAGNANIDAPLDRGWLLGHFKPGSDPRHSTAFEVKWGMHAAGESRAQWVIEEERTAVLVLISGVFRLEFPDRTVRLDTPGDYVVWGEGVGHSWYAETGAVVLTVRAPSVPGYAVPSVAVPSVVEPQDPAAPGDR